MFTKAEKPKENKSRAAANAAQKKTDGKKGLGFVDNQSEAVTQRKI